MRHLLTRVRLWLIIMSMPAMLLAPTLAVSKPGVSTWNPLHHLTGAERADIDAVSCASAGNCALSGANGLNAIVVSESKGRWAHPVVVATGSSNEPAAMLSVSCSAPGSCTAGGSAPNPTSKFDEPTVINASRDVWQEPATLAFPATQANQGGSVEVVSCPNPEDCSVGGWFLDGTGIQQAFVTDERNGEWSPIEVVGLGATETSSQLGGLQCAAPGSCTAIGTFEDDKDQQYAWAESESNFVWSSAHTVSAGSLQSGSGGIDFDALACTGPGDCLAGGSWGFGTQVNGYLTFQAFLVTQHNGHWAGASPISGLIDQTSETTDLACTSSRSCVVDGWCYCVSAATGDDNPTSFEIAEVRGRWGSLRAMSDPVFSSGEVDVGPASCTPVGYCVLGGDYDAGKATLPYLQIEDNGSWTPLEVVRGALGTSGGGYVATVSCSRSGYCEAGGSYSGGLAYVDEMPAPIRLHLTAPRFVSRGKRFDVAISGLTVGTKVELSCHSGTHVWRHNTISRGQRVTFDVSLAWSGTWTCTATAWAVDYRAIPSIRKVTVQ